MIVTGNFNYSIRIPRLKCLGLMADFWSQHYVTLTFTHSICGHGLPVSWASFHI